MRNPNGFTFETSPDGLVAEGETFRCNHCQRHTIIKPFQRPEDIGGLCRSCMGLMCQQCTDLAHRGAACLPFEVKHQQEIEQALERRRSVESYGLR